LVLEIDSSIIDRYNKSVILAQEPIVNPNVERNYRSLNWAKGNLPQYYDLIRVEFTQLYNILTTYSIQDLYKVRPDLLNQKGINDVYRNIVHTLSNTANKLIPFKDKGAYIKHWWDSSLQDAKKESFNCLKT